MNKFVRYNHFKMEDIWSVNDLINKGDYMSKLDLKDTYLPFDSYSQVVEEVSQVQQARDNL